MRYVISFLILLGLLVFIGIKIEELGVIQWVLSSGTYGMNFGVFLTLLVIFVAILMLVFWFVWRVLLFPRSVKGFFSNRKANKANTLLQKGLLALGQGRWKQAENYLAKGARLAVTEKVNTGLFLSGAAEAAQNLGATDRRDYYLLQARKQEIEGDETFSTDLTEAKLMLESGDAEKAVAVLERHHGSEYLTPELLKTEYKARLKLKQYEEAWQMLPKMRKRVFDADELVTARHQLAKKIFSDQSVDSAQIDKTWLALNKSEKQDDDLILAYASSLLAHEKFEEAESVLAESIKKTYSEPLIHAYSQLEHGSLSGMLDNIQTWLRYKPDNAFLHYAVAKYYFKKNELDKAKEHGEKSLSLEGLPEMYALLGKIYEASEEPGLAMKAYKKTVNLVYRESEAKQGELLESAPQNVDKLESKPAE